MGSFQYSANKGLRKGLPPEHDKSGIQACPGWLGSPPCPALEATISLRTRASSVAIVYNRIEVWRSTFEECETTSSRYPFGPLQRNRTQTRYLPSDRNAFFRSKLG